MVVVGVHYNRECKGEPQVPTLLQKYNFILLQNTYSVFNFYRNPHKRTFRVDCSALCNVEPVSESEMFWIWNLESLTIIEIIRSIWFQRSPFSRTIRGAEFETRGRRGSPGGLPGERSGPASRPPAAHPLSRHRPPPPIQTSRLY